MKPLDKHYLSLQFKINIHSKNGTEFQSFFENIMEKAYRDYQKIRPYGNKGDAGNDGYRKDKGIYYQVYSPNTPKLKESYAVKKIQTDFQKLKNGWNEISNIKEYNFVFNDKYYGSVQSLEVAVSKLKINNPNIDFKLFLAKDLENEFYQLSEDDILSLGFNIDQRQAIENGNSYLENVKNELDRENAKYAQKILENIKEIIIALDDENLSLEFEILECRCLQKFEKIDEAKRKYENISKRFPKDPRPILYLAEIYLMDKDFERNRELLEKAESIDDNYWLFKLMQLLRKLHLGEQIDTKKIDENAFPFELKIKANFYRLYALFYENSGDHKNADSFIEKAIHFNPDRFSNYFDELSIIEKRILSIQDNSKKIQKSKGILDKIEKLDFKFHEYGDIGARNKINLNIKKLNALSIQENVPEFEKIAEQTFELSITCYFDKRIEQIIVSLLQVVSLPENALNKLLKYLIKAQKEISDDLSKVLIAQFNIRETIFNEGKKFFNEINNQKYFQFICDIEVNNYDAIFKLIKNDLMFSIAIVKTLKNYSDLRKKIIENLPDDTNFKKEKLLLLINSDKEDIENAFKILRKIDLSGMNYLECKQILKIVQQKKAWDFEVIILEKLLEKERSKKEIFYLKSQLFIACLNLNKFTEVIYIGEQLLIEDSIENHLNSNNKEVLLGNTIKACFERGKIDTKAIKKSKEILEKYNLEKPSFEFRIDIEAEVYFKNNEKEKTLKAIVDGVKLKKVLSPYEYARLYLLWVIKIGNYIDLKINTFKKVKEKTFVKILNKDQWYFIGEDNELDAIPITKENIKYSKLINKKIGEKVNFENIYSSEKREEKIEIIYSIEEYIYWKIVINFQKLYNDGDLEGIQGIEFPKKDDTIDPIYLLKLFEDLNSKTEPFFRIYCKNNVPLALLAVNEGGLTNAIGRIIHEKKGFINFSIGTSEELKKQKETTKKIIDRKMHFYIDCTSAMFLSEIGYFKKIYKYLPNMKVPQSVINYLANLSDKYRYNAGQTGFIGYAQGKIILSSIDKNKSDFIRSNFIETIKLLESNPKNIAVISQANKIDCFSEREIPAELTDACILAQKEKLPILTDDFLYTKMNECETKKKAPEYFSSWSLISILYEEKIISYDEYLEYFNYLSNYRFKFLSISTDDIEKAVFGDGKIKAINPENIRKLNFRLTLSEEYGVRFLDAFTVVGRYLFKVLNDNSVTVDIIEKIFIEIIETFPTKMNKQDLGQMFLGGCLRVIENNRSKFILSPKNDQFHRKIERLLNVTEIFNNGLQLWI